jgi:RNA polymerase sigma factor (sigma-70 family)
VEEILSGSTAASDRFVRDYYPAIYRYLLWLTGRPEAAEDLTQETFVRAWRHLDRFDDRAPLRSWLLCITRREFLRSRRDARPQTALEEAPEVADARTAELTEAVELRAVIRKLPIEEGEVVVLHVDYTVPGWWQWHAPEARPGPGWPALQPATVRERTQEAAHQAARDRDPRVDGDAITPTKLDLAFIYLLRRGEDVHVRRIDPNGSFGRHLTRE